MGRVDSQMKGKDGKVWAALVKTLAENEKRTILRHTVRKLYHLERHNHRGNEEGREPIPNEDIIQTKDPDEGSTPAENCETETTVHSTS